MGHFGEILERIMGKFEHNRLIPLIIIPLAPEVNKKNFRYMRTPKKWL